MRRRPRLALALLAGGVLGVSAWLWWAALHDPFTSEEVSRRLLLGTTRDEAARIVGRPADASYTHDSLKARMSPQAFARFGCPAGGCSDWLRVPVALRLDFDADGTVTHVHSVVLPYHDERFTDKLRRWLHF
jgi:hypothetical protein